MSESYLMTEYAWEDAHAFVDHLEGLCHRGMAAKAFYQELLTGLQKATGATSVSLWHLDPPHGSLLSRQGIDAVDVDGMLAAAIGIAGDWAPQAVWSAPPNSVNAFQRLSLASPERHTAAQLVLRLNFKKAVSSSHRGPTEELCTAALGITSIVWMRERLVTMECQELQQRTRDGIIGSMHRGKTLSDSLATIAAVLAQHTGIERVSIVEVTDNKCRLAATSAGVRIDHRSRHVRRLQDLVRAVIESGEDLSFVVGDGSTFSEDISEALHAYVDDSGCRSIQIERISKSVNDSTPLAAVVFEWFRLTDSINDDADLDSPVESLRSVAAEAIRNSYERDHSAWSALASRWMRGQAKRRSLIACIAFAGLVALLAFLPVELKVPVEGRLVPNRRANLFAPRDATVRSMPVEAGQAIKRGDTLVTLHSPDLDLREKTLSGELAMHQSRLAAVQASKSPAGRATPGRDISSPSDQRVLEKMIESLRERLDLVREQQEMLTVQSPIDGIVQRWDMQQTLQSRPVARGQLLAGVFAPDGGWSVAIDIPDEEIGYILSAREADSLACTFRLRSDPVNVYTGKVARLEPMAHISPEGESVVRATLEFGESDTVEYRAGATVMASLHCGKRPAGSVWFRSLVQWIRTQAWIKG